MSRKRLISHEPTTPIEHLAARAKEYLHLPPSGVDAISILMGAVAGNMLHGEPVWVMLVGAPSSGGSELLGTLMGLPHVHGVGMVDSVAAFLSGTGKKDKAIDATGGLLRACGLHGALVMKDFTSMLSLPEKDLKKILAVLRECYDGHWTRPTGTDGGRALEWHGKLGLFSKVTGEIDRYHTVSASLGERWLYYRLLDDGAGFAKSMQALSNGSRTKWREDLQQLVLGMFVGLDLHFGGKVIEHEMPKRELDDAAKIRVIRMGTIAARCRSSVVRDHYSREKEIIAPPEKEVEARISTALQQLMLGMEVVGVGEADRWRLLWKVSLDSMPALRRAVADLAWEQVGGVGMAEIQARVRCSRGVVMRAVEELEVHGVVRRQGERVEMVEWFREEWRKASGRGPELIG